MRILPQPRFKAVNLLVKFLSKLERSSADPADIYFCYRLLLGRAPETSGWQDWIQRARQGLSRESLVDAVLSSRECVHRHHPKMKPQCIQTEDFTIYVDPNDLDIGQPIAKQRMYEPHITTTLKELLKGDDVFVDLGANMGWFTLMAASMLHQGKVIAVEPNSRNVQLLYRSVIANQFRNVTIFPYAVTDTTALLQLDYAVSNGYVSSLEGSMTSDEYEYVQGVRLDDLLEEEPKIDVIKMDIEGHEPRALQGMRAVIQQHRPILLSEFSPADLRKSSGQSGESYLQYLVGSEYTLAVIEEDGNERNFAQPSEILAYWEASNQKHGTEESIHLDFVARPL